ncbi:unnamed protein product [Arctogadus glacialis]
MKTEASYLYLLSAKSEGRAELGTQKSLVYELDGPDMKPDFRLIFVEQTQKRNIIQFYFFRSNAYQAKVAAVFL